MITWLAPGVFCSSNDDGSIAVWSSASRTWMDLQQSTTLQYDPAWGVANSADSLATGSKLFLVAGHANGFVSLWSGNLDGTGLKLLRGVDVRNPNPTNPWGLHNIRGVSVILWTNTNGYIVTGSEDGYLCVLQLPDGAILSQTVYNLGAQRGINSVAAFGQNLLVSNCSVGPNDNNLWYYWIDGSKWSVTLKDGTNLRVNPEAPQVFNFCTIWGWSNNQPCFFASTEEGALWMGRITPSQRLSVLGYETVYGNLGSALAFNANGELVVVNYNLYEFSTQIKPSIEPSQNPERLPLSLWPPLMENRR